MKGLQKLTLHMGWRRKQFCGHRPLLSILVIKAMFTAFQVPFPLSAPVAVAKELGDAP
jgi:hypothetical protein